MTYTLKEQALALLKSIENSDDACCSWDFTTIREALESIPDEKQSPSLLVRATGTTQ